MQLIIIGICLIHTIAAKSELLDNQMAAFDTNACTQENQQMSHEKKCNLYYRCVYGRKIIKECPDGMLFNTVISNCDSSYNVACGSLETDEDDNKYYGDFFDYYAIEDITSTIIPNNKDQTTVKSLECPEKEDPFEPNPLLPHEEQCNAFYKCFENRKYLMKCPGMLQFNPNILACDWPKNVKCIDKRIFSTTERTESSTNSTYNIGDSIHKSKEFKNRSSNSKTKIKELNLISFNNNLEALKIPRKTHASANNPCGSCYKHFNNDETGTSNIGKETQATNSSLEIDSAVQASSKFDTLNESQAIRSSPETDSRYLHTGFNISDASNESQSTISAKEAKKVTKFLSSILKKWKNS